MTRLRETFQYEWKRGKVGHPRKIWKHLDREIAESKHDNERTLHSIVADESLDPMEPHHIDTWEWAQDGKINRRDYTFEGVDNPISKERRKKGQYTSKKARDKYGSRKTKPSKSKKSSKKKSKSKK